MAEQFLTLMADLDDNSQAIMSGLYSELQKEGFDGVQTHGLPFHISLASYNTDKEKEVIEHIQNVTKDLSEIPVYISHIGVFPGGRVLFGAPDMSDELFDMHKKCLLNSEGNIEEFIWTPHSTFIIDEPERVGEEFYPDIFEVFIADRLAQSEYRRKEKQIDIVFAVFRRRFLVCFLPEIVLNKNVMRRLNVFFFYHLSRFFSLISFSNRLYQSSSPYFFSLSSYSFLNLRTQSSSSIRSLYSL